MTPAQPATPAGVAGWQALIANPAHALVALDFDGTLAPVVADPERAFAHPGAAPVLSRLSSRLGTLALVTGRPVEAVLRLVDVGHVRGLVILGQYGVERWEGGTVSAPPPPPAVALVRAALPALLADLGLPSALVEDKGRAVAVHVREQPDPTEALERLAGPIAGLAAEHGLVVEPGRLVLEVRGPGTDKGQALRRLTEERAAGCVVYAGDDLGDLAAYDAVAAMRGEGRPGLLICAASVEQLRLAPRADVVVGGPDGVVAWLEELARHLRAESAPGSPTRGSRG